MAEAVPPDHDPPPDGSHTIYVTPTDLRDSEWGRSLDERLKGHDLRWTWARRALVALGPVAVSALVLGLGWLRSSSDAAGAARERESIRADDHRLLLELRDNLAEIRGELRAISRLGAVRLLGPSVKPLVPQGDL